MKTPLCHARLAGALPLAGRLITGLFIIITSLLITSLLSACATNPEATKATGVGGKLAEATAKAATSIVGAPLIPEATVQLGPSVAYPLEKLVYWGIWVGAAYLILDPFAPNWRIEEARLPDNHFHLSLSMKRYYAGGAGEARAVFHRRAKELMRAGGFASYVIVEYAEGMESSFIGAQRTANGVVRFYKRTG